MAKLISTGEHAAVLVPGRLHGVQIMRLGQLLDQLINEGGWGSIKLEIRGGNIHQVGKETTELFAPDRLRTTA